MYTFYAFLYYINKWLLCMSSSHSLCKSVLANTRRHQLCWGDWEMGLLIYPMPMVTVKCNPAGVIENEQLLVSKEADILPVSDEK